MLQNEAQIDSAHTQIFNLQSQFMTLVPVEYRTTVVRGEEFNAEHWHQKVIDRQHAMISRINELQHTISDLHHREGLEQ